MLRFSPGGFHSPHFQNSLNGGNFNRNFNNNAHFNNRFHRTFNRTYSNFHNNFNYWNSSYNYSNWQNWRSYAPRHILQPWSYQALSRPSLALPQLQQQLNILLYRGQVEPRYLQFQRWPIEMDARYAPRLEPYAVQVARKHSYTPHYRTARDGAYANRYREHPAWKYGTGAEEGPAA